MEMILKAGHFLQILKKEKAKEVLLPSALLL